MIKLEWRTLFIDFIKDQKLHPGADEKSTEAKHATNSTIEDPEQEFS